MANDEYLNRAERCLKLFLTDRSDIEERKRSRREFDEKFALLTELQDKNQEAFHRMTEDRDRDRTP